jgi:hypothetical protein
MVSEAIHLTDSATSASLNPQRYYAMEHHRVRPAPPMKTHVMVNGVNHLTDSTVQPPCHSARCLPPVSMTLVFQCDTVPLRCYTVRCLPLVSMTWIFAAVRCATEHRRVRRVPPMKTSVMVSEANHLTDSPLSPIELHRITVRCLPLVSMTLIFAVTRRAMEHHRVRLAPPMKTYVMVNGVNHLAVAPCNRRAIRRDASRRSA